MSDTSVDSRIEQQKFKKSTQPSEKYYPITEKEISTFVQHSSQIDRETRSLAQEIYSRGMVSLSGDVALIKDLNYEIHTLKNKISEYGVKDNKMREEGAKKSIEELWKFCLESGAEQHGDLLALPKDPFFPLKLIKKVAEMHSGVGK